jgi:hypothetical protein
MISRPGRFLVATVTGAALLAGCSGGDSGGMSASLADVDVDGEMWAISSSCDGGSFSVDFVPGERLAVADVASVSYEEIAIECGEAERVAIGPEDGAPVAVDVTEPVYATETLSCDASGTLVVSVNPIWGERSIVGSSLQVEQGGRAVLAGSLKRDEYGDKDGSRVAWSRAVCRAG